MILRQSLILVASFVLFASRQPSFGQIPESKITSGLEDVLQTAGPDSLVPVIVALEGERSFTEAERQVMQGMVRSSRQTFVARERVNFAKQRREVLMEAVASAEELGFAKNVRPLSIANAVALQGTSSFIRSIAARSEVLWIGLDSPISVFRIDRGHTSVNGMSAESQSPWGLTAIRADEVWDLGLEGQGVLVMTIDTGIRMSHVDLRDRLWDGRGVISGNVLTYEGQSLVNHGWDTVDQDNNPEVTMPVIDNTDHGTRVAGVVAGDGTSGTSTGVAPEAQLLIMRGFTNTQADNAGAESWILQAFSWIEEMKAIHGDEFEVPAVVNLSAGVVFNWKPKYALWRDVMNDIFDLDVVVIAAAGNSGRVAENPGQNYCDGDYPIGQRIPYNIATPANVPSPWLHPDQPAPAPGASGPHVSAVLAVGATGEFDEHREYSSIGPSAWENIESIYACQHPIPSNYWDFLYETGGPNGLIKPDLAAPDNVLTTSAYGDSEHRMFSGTSAAAPHVAGTAALLISANEDITAAQIAEALQSSAVDAEPTGKDNYFGAGRIDAYAAAIYVLENFGGTIGGAGMTLVFPDGLTIASGKTLTIRPGTTVKFGSGKRLKVYGELIADGNPAQPITLTGSSTWGGVYFTSGSEGTLDNVTVDKVQGWGGASIYMTNADVWITYSTIKNCAGACNGIQATNNSYLWIYHSTIENNSNHGVYISGSTAYLIRNKIEDNATASGNQAGVYVTYYANPLFGYPSYPYYEGRNTITGGEYGVYATNHGSPDVGTGSSLAYNNRLFGSSLYNAYASSNSDVVAKYVWWENDQVNPNSTNCQPTKIYGAVTWYPCKVGDPGESFKTGGELTPIVVEDDRVRELLVSAIDDRHTGSYDSAFSTLQDILSKTPDAPEVERAVIELGYLYAETGDSRVLSLLEAWTERDEAIAATAKEVLMLAHFRVGNDDIGRSIADGLILDHPGTDHERNARLALFYAGLDGQDRDGAQREIDHLTSLFPGDEDVLSAAWLASLEGITLGNTGKSLDEDGALQEATAATVEVYPNPFNPAVTIEFSVAFEGTVRLTIHDVLGREVARLIDTKQPAGRHEIVFDGSGLPTGVYLYRLEADGRVKSGSVILVK